MTKKTRRLFNQSYSWIRSHPDATNLDVPDDLLGQWIFEDKDEDPKPTGYFITVFSFGFLQLRLLTDGLPDIGGRWTGKLGPQFPVLPDDAAERLRCH
jgi:hypothetical protein